MLMTQETTKQKALITGMNVIAIYVSDLERAKDFYVNTLGMAYREDMSGGKGIILMAADSMFYVEGGVKSKLTPR
jgi:catechol 2,3-dioxygenase-like lactoylglutathione lyase family enzyme